MRKKRIGCARRSVFGCGASSGTCRCWSIWNTFSATPHMSRMNGCAWRVRGGSCRSWRRRSRRASCRTARSARSVGSRSRRPRRRGEMRRAARPSARSKSWSRTIRKVTCPTIRRPTIRNRAWFVSRSWPRRSRACDRCSRCSPTSAASGSTTMLWSRRCARPCSRASPTRIWNRVVARSFRSRSRRAATASVHGKKAAARRFRSTTARSPAPSATRSRSDRSMTASLHVQARTSRRVSCASCGDAIVDGVACPAVDRRAISRSITS